MAPHESQPSTIDPSLARLQRGYSALLALVDDLPEGMRDQPGACGDWSPRQLLAHLSGWLMEANSRYLAIKAGDRIDRQYDADADHAAFNQESVASRAALSWDETVADLKASLETFVAEAQATPRDRMADDERYGEWLDWLWKDCVEHMGQLCRFVLSGTGS